MLVVRLVRADSEAGVVKDIVLNHLGKNDPRKVVEAGLACMPVRSPYAMLISDVLAWSKQHPQDWRKVWHLIEDKWNKRESCPEGALKPFNIDAKLNGGYIALGLLYGKGDFWKFGLIFGVVYFAGLLLIVLPWLQVV